MESIGIDKILFFVDPGWAMFWSVFVSVWAHMGFYTLILLAGLQAIPPDDWRPSVIMVNGRTFDRRAPLDLLRWLCHRHGFGTYLHYIQGHLNAKSMEDSHAT